MNTKQLFLFRHAKSAWPDGVADHERPLAERGVKAAPLMAAYMRAEGLVPDLALVSTARRTQETWALVEPAMSGVERRDEARLYEAHAEDLLRLVHETGEHVEKLMLVGHNPGLEILALQIMRPTPSEAEEQLKRKFPTAALAVLTVETERWADLSADGATLTRFITPKILKKMSQDS
ncbi:histidine phosphatase family protein [Rhizobium sp. L1K21]|uniref:SixA phosphatase family protein n=1 Tax=Rhizobium sp. L1K21 TaxID=2954933 RepID=UPI0020922980|nr:histidine phosphatase family protein [Rhizobium sp. L1K21]MCO6188100.1 histidine phosphatase family protein [Rhizobium sp. L1K21]